jgi:hypothetical protein
MAESVGIWTPHGEVKVGQFKEAPQSKNSTKAKTQGTSGYAYAVFKSVPGSQERMTIEKGAGVKFLSVYDIQNGHVIYLIKATEPFDVTATLLAQFSRRFFNLEPIYGEDKLSRKILSGKGFTEKEIDRNGKIAAHIEFFPDITRDKAEGILKWNNARKRLRKGNQFEVREKLAFLRSLANLPEVMSVIEEDTTDYPTNYQARELTGVNSIQSIDTSIIYPPDTSWMSGDSLTGDSIYVGIYDTGIDSLHKDFREMAGVDTILRRSPIDTFPWSPGEHGTHVAGIVGGNGWSSAEVGAPRLYWRGVAPKVLFINRGMSDAGDEGDVNNHSHVPGFTTGDYDAGERSIDNELWPHQRLSPQHPDPSHVIVYAAANNGGTLAQYGRQRGYYSLLAEPKNAIVVGALNKNDTLRSTFSSMGPTRDGRLKPDVMAPGSEGAAYPPRNHRFPTHVEFDYIRILDSAGSVKHSWEFNSSADGWDHDAGKTLCCGWAGVERSEISTPVHSGSVIRFDVFTLDLSYMWSDSIQQPVLMA